MGGLCEGVDNCVDSENISASRTHNLVFKDGASS